MSRQLCGICMCPYDEEDGSCGCTEVNQECNSMEMNKPVAWMSNEYSVCSKKAYENLSQNARSWYPIPLYLHPAELTDEEIMEVYVGSEIWVPDNDMTNLFEFAKAIMKKCGIISGTDK